MSRVSFRSLGMAFALLCAIVCLLATSPIGPLTVKRYATKVLEVYPVVQGADLKNREVRKIAAVSGVFGHPDGSFSTELVPLDVFYRWQNGDRNIWMMVKRPAEEAVRAQWTQRFLMGFAISLVALGLIITFAPCRVKPEGSQKEDPHVKSGLV